MGKSAALHNHENREDTFGKTANTLYLQWVLIGTSIRICIDPNSAPEFKHKKA